MAKHAYWAYGRTGGASGDLDAIDGAVLTDVDAFIYIPSPRGLAAFYTLDDDYDTAESAPYTLVPDTNPGTKNLRMLGVQGASGDFTSLNISGISTLTGRVEMQDLLYVSGTASFDGNLILTADLLCLNWGATGGATGYGIRTNASSDLQYKHSGGAWRKFCWNDIPSSSTYVDAAETDGGYKLNGAHPYTAEALTFDVTGDEVVDGITNVTIDGDWWGKGDQYGFDLGTAKTIKRIKCYCYCSLATPTTWYRDEIFAIMYSSDNVTYTELELVTLTQNSTDGNLTVEAANQISFQLDISGSVSARYWKVVFDTSNAGNSVACNPGGGSCKANELEGYTATIYPQHASWDYSARLGADQYISWGSAIGSSGYGLRDNSGDIEFKHSGGAWERIPDFEISSAATGDTLYYDGSDWVNTDTRLIHLAAETVINEDGADLDFRVEASGVANAFFIQGSNGDIGIGTGTPTNMLHLVHSGSEHPNIMLENTSDTDTRSGELHFYHNEATPADGSKCGVIDFQDNDSLGNSTNYANIVGYASDVTDGVEAGKIVLGVRMNNTSRDMITMNGYNGTANQGEIIFNDEGQDVDFRVETALNANGFLINGGTGDVTIGDGDLIVQNTTDAFTSVKIGVEDSKYGWLYLWGAAAGSGVGGGISFYLAADHDAAIDNYQIRPADDDLIIGPNTDTNALKLDSNKDFWVTDGDMYVQVGGLSMIQLIASSGDIAVGIDDTFPGDLTAYGAGGGSTQGGRLFLYLAADHDAAIAYYLMSVYQDDLYIGPDTDTNFVLITAEKQFIITDGDAYIRNPTDDLAILGIGQQGYHRGEVRVYGDNTGTAQGGTLYLYTADDHDAVINDYRLQANEDDLWIGLSTDEDALKYDGGNNRWDFTTWVKNTYPAYDDLRVPANVTKLGSTSPDWEVYNGNVKLLSFDAGTQQNVHFVVQLPHKWKVGTNITPHVHWMPAASEDGPVRCRWMLEYEWQNINAVFEGTTLLYTQSTTSGDEDTRLFAKKHYVSNFAAINGAGKTISSILMCRLSRDATATYDTLSSDAGLLEIDFHYQVDGWGSDGIDTKS